MDKIAVISDVHGNMPALETVLEDIQQRGIEMIYNLGDIIGKGPRSPEAVDLCREACQVIIKGNWEEAVPRSAMRGDEGAVWYCDQLGAERLAYLDGLPDVHDFWMSGKRVRLYHASHESVHTRIYPWQSYETHLAMFENTPFTGMDVPAPDVVGYGDIHSAYMLSLYREQKILFNTGSAGNPMDMPLATYAILNGKLDSQEPGSFSVDFVRLPYDIERAVADAEAVPVLPELEAYVVELRTAVYRGRQYQNENSKSATD